MNIDVVRAWKDAQYRESLSSEELALVPANPAGEVELVEEDLLSVMGGGGSLTCCKNISVCVNTVLC
jgi:mersacidin/lichenicidin family type 2 lantibiotic